MKFKIGTTTKIVIFVAVGIWILSLIPFNQKVNQEIDAEVYEDGVAVKDAKVYIEGEKSNYLFRSDDSFHGKFHISTYEKTNANGMNASISWQEKYNIQDLLFSQHGTFPSMDTIGAIIINEKMSSFAFMFADGSVIATSDELYKLYTKHVSYDAGTGTTFTELVNEIPKIK